MLISYCMNCRKKCKSAKTIWMARNLTQMNPPNWPPPLRTCSMLCFSKYAMDSRVMNTIGVLIGADLSMFDGNGVSNLPDDADVQENFKEQAKMKHEAMRKVEKNLESKMDKVRDAVEGIILKVQPSCHLDHWIRTLCLQCFGSMTICLLLLLLLLIIIAVFLMLLLYCCRHQFVNVIVVLL